MLIESKHKENIVNIKMASSELSDKTEDCVIQEYVNCPTEKRFMLLNTLLKRNADKKVIVVCSSISTINFLSELLGHFKLSVTVAHDSMTAKTRADIFGTFSKVNEMLLLCTENSLPPAANSTIDWFVQYDPPVSLRNYLQLLKNLNGATHKLIFLRPEEMGFLPLLQKRNISNKEFEVKWSKVSNIQSEVLKLTSKVYAVHMAASEGYRNFVKSYAGHPFKKIFDVDSLDLQKVAQGFGLNVAPFVDTEAVKKSKRAAKSEPEDAPIKKKVKTIPVIKQLVPVKSKKKRIHK